MMAEGVSIRAISRMTGASKNTIVKLLRDAGTAFAEYQDKALRNLECKRLRLDEIWSFVGAKPKRIVGNPKREDVSTSYAERMNLNIRVGLRRFTRLTNAFSKKIENHFFALAIYFMHYNFVRIHQLTRVTPAMASGVAEKLWELRDLVAVVEAWERGEENPKTDGTSN